ncbi:hypothetical protein V6N13_124150 [Hibiscus sabdariffa]
MFPHKLGITIKDQILDMSINSSKRILEEIIGTMPLSQGGNNGHGPNSGYGPNFDQRDFRGDHRNYAPSQGGNNGQGPNPGYGHNFDQRDFRGDHKNYAPSQGGNNGQ